VKKLGGGNFGTGYEAIDTITNERVCVKTFHNLSQETIESW
jgi:hypothetical protein